LYARPAFICADTALPVTAEPVNYPPWWWMTW